MQVTHEAHTEKDTGAAMANHQGATAVLRAIATDGSDEGGPDICM